ncbi:MAG TPA: ferritin-like domain-containing protein [Polyangiaceae bacterium]|jgi:ferritin-like protein|nr:ferritin-like domain-containing protein [Polyangiaceae bacterium]
MAQSSTTLHESNLPPEIVDRHRAIVSLMEELEAVDWYDQRVHATTDEALRALLAHNRDEEKEHASMTLEWLRRNDPVWAEHLATYLDTQGPITEIEADAQEAGDAAAAPSSSVDGSLGIGSLKGK